MIASKFCSFATTLALQKREAVIDSHEHSSRNIAVCREWNVSSNKLHATMQYMLPLLPYLSSSLGMGAEVVMTARMSAKESIVFVGW